MNDKLGSWEMQQNHVYGETVQNSGLGVNGKKHGSESVQGENRTMVSDWLIWKLGERATKITNSYILCCCIVLHLEGPGRVQHTTTRWGNNLPIFLRHLDAGSVFWRTLCIHMCVFSLNGSGETVGMHIWNNDMQACFCNMNTGTVRIGNCWWILLLPTDRPEPRTLSQVFWA